MGRSLKTVVTLTTVFLLLVLTLPDNGRAFPYQVEGYLKDSEGNPIPFATLQVTGTIYNMSSEFFEETTISFPENTTTNGYFRLAFEVNQAGFTNDPLTLSYTDGEVTASRTFTPIGVRIWLNLTTGSESSPLDFLLSPPGMALIVIIVFGMIVGVYWLKTTGKEEEDMVEEAKRKVGRRRQ
jgi:hypothetical protein